MASLQTLSKSFPAWVFFCCCCCLPLLLTSSLPLKGASTAQHACRLRKINFQQPYIRNRTYTLAKMVQSCMCSSWWDLLLCWCHHCQLLAFLPISLAFLQEKKKCIYSEGRVWVCGAGLLPAGCVARGSCCLFSKGKAAPGTAQLLLFRQLLPRWVNCETWH